MGKDSPRPLPTPTPVQALAPKAKAMPGSGTASSTGAGSSEGSGRWVQCWIWMPSAQGTGLAPYMPADVASGAPPGSAWGKGDGKGAEETEVSW